MKRYQRDMTRHREAEEARRNCRISVFTIEEGSQRQTIIDYNTQARPPIYKNEELPPAYYEAVKMSIMHPQNSSSSSTAIVDTQNTQPRRNSAAI
jgi:hypothetical protein